MGRMLRLALAAALLAGCAATGARAAEPRSAATVPLVSAPVCLEPSHDRLIIRKGRDVCGGTLGRRGRPAAAGYLPTACIREELIYRIDDNGLADRCRKRASNQGDK
jgi:hypothetical protein